jgi:hypothetical protein
LQGEFFSFYFQRRFIFFLLRHDHSIGILDVLFEFLQGGTLAKDTWNFFQFSYIPLIVDLILKCEFTLHIRLLRIYDNTEATAVTISFIDNDISLMKTWFYVPHG